MALIVDTGVLFASLNRNDDEYASCRALLDDFAEPIVIPAPVLVEVDYLVGRWLRPAVFLNVLDDVVAGNCVVEAVSRTDYQRVRELCAQYADSDIGFVDASVVALAERMGEDKIATLDRRHFAIIRPRHVESFRLLPD